MSRTLYKLQMLPLQNINRDKNITISIALIFHTCKPNSGITNIFCWIYYISFLIWTVFFQLVVVETKDANGEWQVQSKMQTSSPVSYFNGSSTSGNTSTSK